MKRLTLAVALISAALLSGCIVVPSHRYYHGGYRGGYQDQGGHDHDRGGYGPGRR